MEGSGGKPVVGPTRTHNRRRHSGLLLHFTDLPSWNEEQARRREEKRRKSLAEIGPEAESAVALCIPSLQEISARAAAVFESFTQVDYTTVPDVIVDMVRGYMDKDAQIRSFRCYRDYYPATVSSNSSSLSSSSQSGAATHKRRRAGASSPVVRLLQQPNKTTLLWTVQHYNHNGQLDGESLWYFRSGQKACQEHYRLDQLHGPARTWYKSGKMESEREWSEGQLQGHSREWYPDGKLKTHELWQRGVREKVLVADGRKLTDRARECLFGTSRLRVGAHASLSHTNNNNGSSTLGGLPGLAWLSLDGGVRSSGRG